MRTSWLLFILIFFMDFLIFSNEVELNKKSTTEFLNVYFLFDQNRDKYITDRLEGIDFFDIASEEVFFIELEGSFGLNFRLKKSELQTLSKIIGYLHSCLLYHYKILLTVDEIRDAKKL